MADNILAGDLPGGAGARCSSPAANAAARRRCRRATRSAWSPATRAGWPTGSRRRAVGTSPSTLPPGSPDSPSAPPTSTCPARCAARASSKAPFDRRRYQLLCLICRRARAAPGHHDRAARRRRHRRCRARHEPATANAPRFVDALRALIAWGAVRASGGDVDAFLDSDRGNAILNADTARLHRLVVERRRPEQRSPTASTPTAAIAALLAEPRYGDAAVASGRGRRATQRLRWVRHTARPPPARRSGRPRRRPLVAERDYLATPSGRRWLRERVAEAGFELEERAEGFLAVDPDSDRHRPRLPRRRTATPTSWPSC